MLQTSLLDDRAVVAVSGAEARDFLQGLVSNDMALCSENRPLYAGLLTPQGKILFDFFIVERDGGFLIDCAAARAADLIKRLSLYKLRAKIEIAARPDNAVAAAWGNGAGVGLPDPRLPALGTRTIAPRPVAAAASPNGVSGDYMAHRLSLGVPDGADLPPDTVLALDAGFEELHGVSFKKGCYVGQEVTARMKHRATARKRFVIAETDGLLPPLGTAIESEGREIGTMATGQNGRALALVRLDRLAETEAAGTPVAAGGQPIRLRKPAWLKM